jgi:hypothetical protein
MSNDTRRLTLDHIWIMTILSCIWFFMSITPLPPNDLWWHMAAGRIMVLEGTWMFTNRWAYTVAYDAVFVLQSWLSEIMLYVLWSLGDVPLLALTRTVTITTAYGVMAWQAWRRVRHGQAVAFALLLAILVGWSNWTLRPQTLALVPAVGFVAILGESLAHRLSARWLLALPGIMILWVNMHGSFILGIGLLGLAWVGTLIDAIRGMSEQQTIARSNLGPLTVAVVGTSLATLIQPLGIGIFEYVRMTITHPLHSKWFIEWLPPKNTLDVANSGFWFFFVMLLLAALMALNTRRPTATDVLWYSTLAWLTIGGGRYAMWFALFLVPLLADNLAPLLPQRKPPILNRFALGTFAGILSVGTIVLCPWFQPAHYLGSDIVRLFASSGPYRFLLSNTTPVAATEWLIQHPIEGRFWTDMSYTSYTLWKIPDTQVFADLRVELFPEKVWEDYFAIARGNSSSLTVLDTWHVTHLMLDTDWQKSLYHGLSKSPEWCERYREGRAAIFERCH